MKGICVAILLGIVLFGQIIPDTRRNFPYAFLPWPPQRLTNDDSNLFE